MSPSRVSRPVSQKPRRTVSPRPKAGSQPSQTAEDGDEENPGEEDRDRDAENAQAQNEPRAKRTRADRAIDSRRHGEQEHDQARAEHELEACGKFGEDDIERRPLVDGGGAEIALDRAAEIARELHRPGRIEAELVAKLLRARLRAPPRP